MIAILGGGITALALGTELKKMGKSFVLIEAESKCGGKIKSDTINSYQIEHGPNTVLINNPEIDQFIDDLDLRTELIFADQEAVKNRMVLKGGKLEAIPSSLSSAWSSNLFKTSTLLSILKEPFIRSKKDDGEESLADFSRRRFGKQILSDFITPFISGIYAGDPEKMSVEHTLSILKEAEDLKGSVLLGAPKILKNRKANRADWEAPKNKIFSFKSGLGRMIEKASNQLEDHLQLNARIEKLEYDEKSKKYKISYRQDQELKQLEADQVVSCLPSLSLAKLLDDEELTQRMNSVNYVPAVVTHFGIKKEQLLIKEKSFGLLSRKEENVPFLGVLFNSYFFPHQSSEDKFLITAISGGYRHPEMIHRSDDEIVEQLQSSLQELGIFKGEAEFSNIIRWDEAIPQYELGYSEILNAIEQFQLDQPTFHIAGNFYKGISVSDCVANGVKLASKLS